MVDQIGVAALFALIAFLVVPLIVEAHFRKRAQAEHSALAGSPYQAASEDEHYDVSYAWKVMVYKELLPIGGLLGALISNSWPDLNTVAGVVSLALLIAAVPVALLGAAAADSKQNWLPRGYPKPPAARPNMEFINKWRWRSVLIGLAIAVVAALLS